MSMIDAIRKDREAGTPGPWQADEVFMQDGHPTRVATPDIDGIPAATLAECFQDWEDFRVSWKNAEANARRCARVPDMEAALLAAEELADAVDEWGAKGRTEATAAALNIALGNYRAATGGAA